MVTKFGMSSAVGAVSFGSGGEVFIGRDMAQAREYSESTAQQIDLEVRTIVEAAHKEAYQALNLNRAILDELAKELMERETLNQEEIAEIFKGVKKLPQRKIWLSATDRPVSKKPPIAIPVKGSSASKQAVIDKAQADAAAPAKKPRAPRKPKAENETK